MTLDPQANALLDQMATLGGPAVHEVSVEEARQMLRNLSALSGPGEDVARVEDGKVPGPGGMVPIRIYVPEGDPPFGVLVWYHGGGWVLGDLETTDNTCRALTNAAGVVVVSVDYRLAPEHKFPGAADDAYAALTWVHDNAASFGGDPERIAVGGDSAGGNLAAVTALQARDRGAPPVRFQLLVYPVTDASFATESYEENAEGYLLTREGMKWFWQHYLSCDDDAANCYAAPIRADDLSGLPPALVITAGYDPLRDEGEAYAERMREAGVDARAKRYDGQIHGFFGMTGILDAAREAVDEAAAALRSALTP